MGANSAISWCDATWQVVAGCTRVSPGCEHCYSERLLATRLRHLPWAAGLTRDGAWTGKVLCRSDQLAVPFGWRSPKVIFVGDRGDIFHPEVPFEFIAALFGVMAASPQHTFLVLTKRAARMREAIDWLAKRGEDGARLFPDDPLDWRVRQLCHVEARRHGVDMNHDSRQNHGGPWPLPNVWLGVTAEDQQRADERIPLLLQTPAAHRWVSVEPMLGPIDLRRFMWPVHWRWDGRFSSPEEALAKGAHATRHRQRLVHADSRFLDQVIVGGESGPGARSYDLAWGRSIIAQCRDAGVSCFHKQVGSAPHDAASLRWVPSVYACEHRLMSVDGRCVATAWDNGGWHTWDRDGVGGENWTEADLAKAKSAAESSVIRQGFAPIRLKSRAGSDPAEWPEDLRVRELAWRMA